MGRLSHPFAVSYIVKKQGNNNYQINNKSNNNNNNNKNNNKDSNNNNNNNKNNNKDSNNNNNKINVNNILNSFLTIVGSWYLTNKVLHSLRKEESQHKGQAQFMDVQYFVKDELYARSLTQ